MSVFPTESIEALLNAASHDSESVQSILKLLKEHTEKEPQAVLNFAIQTQKIAEKINDTESIAMSAYRMAKCHEYLSEYNLSIQKYLEVLVHLDQGRNKTIEPDVLDGIGANYYQLGDFETSLRYSLQALKKRKANKDDNGKGYSLMHIGSIYSRLKDYDSALEYYKQALEQFNDFGSIKQKASLMGNMGGVYALTGDLDKALDYFFQSLKIREEILDDRNKGVLLNNIGQTYLLKKDFEKARSNFYESIRIHHQHNNRSGEASALLNMGELALLENKPEIAIDCLLKALHIAEELKLKYHAYHIHEMLFKAYSASGDYQSSLEHHVKYHQMKEEVHNQDSDRKIQNIQYIHQLQNAQKESEIERLKNVELKKAYEEIDEKKRQLESSIVYARKIQEAILPSGATIRQGFPDSFGFFRSRDVVSGDFFWYADLRGLHMIASADCTGHGVPGALMSMIGIEKLNFSVREKQLDHPSEILSLLNQNIKTVMKQNEQTQQQDGMDIALCVFDENRKWMEYAGANRPLLMIRNGAIQEIEPTKQAIGGRTDNQQVYASHRFDLQPGDTFYLFSDGYADQFGGANGKKFMKKRFKEMLLSIQHLNMRAQRKVVVDTLEEWMNHSASDGKTYEQTDDISVIGIRV